VGAHLRPGGRMTGALRHEAEADLGGWDRAALERAREEEVV
jgi:hypothetical protein